MAEKTLSFGDAGDDVTVEDYTVYLRSAWTSEETWVQHQNLVAVETTWSLAPTLPCAALEWRFGWMRQVREPAAEDDQKKWKAGGVYRVERLTDLRGRLCKIRHGDGRIWVGVLRPESEQQGGAQGSKARKARRRRREEDSNLLDTGLQRWHAYGLEHLLDVEPIASGVYETGEDETARTYFGGLTFNPGGKGNRSSEAQGSLYHGDGVYVFAGEPTGTEEHHWSTQQIVKYLLAHHQPLDAEGDPVLGADPGLVLSDQGAGALPDWDRPTLSTDGKTLYQLLTELIDRRRLLGWFLKYTEGGEDEDDPTAADDSVELHVVTFSDKAIDDPVRSGGEAVTANPRVRHLEFEVDPLTTAAYQQGELGNYDQVVVRGERRRHVFTMDRDYLDDTHPSMAEDWTADEQTQYLSGAELLDEWADANRRDRQRLAAMHRARYERVFSYWKLPDDWDGQTIDRTSELAAGGFNYWPVFPGADDRPMYPRVLELEPTLPLLAGVDYSDSKIVDGDYDESEATVEAPPLVVLERVASEQPEEQPPTYYVPADAVGLAAGIEPLDVDQDHVLSCEVFTSGRNLIVKVRNAPQHALHGAVIAGSLLPDDEPVPLYNSRFMLATVSVRGERIEARWPPDEKLEGAGRVIRRKYLDAPGVGETYVVSGTVVGCDAAGVLKRTSRPGTIPARVGKENPQLRAIARLAAVFYLEPRRVATIRTLRPLDPDDLDLGDYIGRCGEDDSPAKRQVNGPLTQITYHTPLGQPGRAQPPERQLTTWHGELDAARLVPEFPGRDAARRPASDHWSLAPVVFPRR